MANQLQNPGVYDPEGEKKPGYSRPDIGPGHNKPAGKSSDPRGENVAAGDSSDPRGAGGDSLDRGGLRQAEAGADSGGFYNPGGDQTDGASSESPGDLRSSEGSAGSQFATSGFEPGQKSSRGAKRGAGTKAKSFARRHKSALGIVGGLAGGGMAGLIIALFLLIPLKIEHIINNLQSRFFSSSQTAVSSMTQTMLQDYLVHYVLPAYRQGHCSTTRDRTCTVRILNGRANPVLNLYRSYAHTKIENKLANQYGITFEYRPVSRTWYITAPGTAAGGDNIGPHGERLEAELTHRKQVSAAVNTGMEGATSFKKLLYRYKVDRMMSTKYSWKRCIIACSLKQKVKTPIRQAKQSAKIYLTQRVIIPHDQTLGIVLECLFSNCDATKTQPSDATQAPELGGAPENPETDTKVRQTLGDIAAKYSGADMAQVLATYNEIGDVGMQKFITTKILTSAGIDAATAGTVSDAIPVIGWINAAANIINSASNVGPNIKKLAYVASAYAAVNLYENYRTYADEIHTGNVDPTEVGSWTDSLGSGNTGRPNDPELGGTASAEQTPLYHALLNNNNPAPPATTASLASSLLPGTAYAAAAGGSNSYTCKNGHPVPTGSLVCSEEVFSGGNGIANSIHDFLNNTPGVGIITTLAKGWTQLFGPITNFLNSISSTFVSGLTTAADAACSVASLLPFGAAASLPGIGQIDLYCQAKDAVNSAIPTVAKAVTTALIPNPFSTNMSGGRTFDMMAGGADVAGNSYAQTGLGAKKVSTPVANAIYQQQQDEARQQFNQESLFARMFNTDSQFSLVSSLAMATPVNLQASAQTGFASMISNPFGVFGNSLASLFSGKASAAPAYHNDPFGVTQYAYTANDMAAIGDPATYWDNHCSDNAAQDYQSDADFAAHGWNKAASDNLDPATELPTNTTTNPCPLIKTTVGSDGGAADTSLLAPADLTDTNGGAGSPTGTTSSGGCGGSGKYSALVSSGSSFAGTDQGIDFVPTGSGGFDICAPASGTITLADQTGHHFNRTSGQAEIIEKLDQSPSAPSSSQYIYYAEIIQIDSSIHVTGHVNKGDTIGHSDQSPGIEVGWAPDATHGFMCTLSGGATPCGQSFDSWVQGQ